MAEAEVALANARFENEAEAVAEDEEVTTEEGLGAVQQEEAAAALPQWTYFEALDRQQEVVRHRKDFAGPEEGQAPNRFLKGVKWSPDGLCLLSNCDDNVARLHEVPYDENATVERPATLSVSPGDTIFDFAWYPRMHSSQPATCCFTTTSRGRPVHLWDAFTGKLRASYSAYDDMDELTAALSTTFSASGDQIIGGFNQEVL
jgi:WD40 repeat protein